MGPRRTESFTDTIMSTSFSKGTQEHEPQPGKRQTSHYEKKYKCCYLGEGEAVFVLVFVLDLEVVESFALRWRLGQGLDALDVAGREETMTTVQFSMVPVFVHLPAEDDDVALVELEVSWLLPLVAVEGLPAWKLRDILKNK